MFSQASKVYDNHANTVPAFTLSTPDTATYPNFVMPMNLTATDFDTSTAASQNVGHYPVVLTADGVQKLQAVNPNYIVSADSISSGLLSITPKAITITGPQLTKTYDGNSYAGNDVVAAVTGEVDNVKASFQLADISSDVNAGDYDINVLVDGTSAVNHNYVITTVAGKLEINKDRVTIAAPQGLSKVYDGDGYTVNDGMVTVTGKPENGSPVNYHLSSLEDAVNAGTYSVNVTDTTDNPNYDITVVPSTFSVTKNTEATVQVGSASKTYDNDENTNPKQYVVMLPAGVNAPSDWSADDFEVSGNSQNVGSYAVTLSDSGIQKLNAANTNYGFNAENIETGQLTITPAPISITAPNLTKQYDGYPYTGALTPVITGVPAQGIAPVYTLPSLNDDVDAGNYPILVDVSANDNPNYTISTTPGQLTINPMTPQFRFMIDATYQLFTGKSADNQHVYKVTITGADLVQPQWTPEDFVVSGTPGGVGSYPVTLSSTGWKKLQQANPNDVISADPAEVTPGELVIEPIDVEKADLGQIQVGSQTKVYDGETDDPTNYTVTLPDKLIAPVWTASDFERQGTSETAGNYSVTLSDSGLTALRAANPNYVISAEDITSGQLMIAKAPVTITAPSGLSKTDDGQPYSGSATGKVTGQPANGTSVVYQLDYGNNGSDGTHLITVIADPKLNPNYDITAVSSSYQILPQPVVVTPSVPVETKQPQSVVVTPFVPAKMKQPQTVVKNSTLPVKPVIVNYLVDETDPSTHQTVAIVPPAHELDEAKHIVESAPEHGELVASSQTGSNSGRSTNKHNKRTVSPVSKQTTQNGTQQVNHAGNSPYRTSTITAGKQSAQPLTQLSSSQSPETGTDEAAVAGQLPQTNETQSSWFAILGATLMSLLGLLGFKKRRSDR